jgi:hypothetical protein
MKTAIQKRLVAAAALALVAGDTQGGRWLSRDPIQEGSGFVQRDPIGQRSTLHSSGRRWPLRHSLGEAGGANLYAFVQNRPVGETDLLGLCRCSIVKPLEVRLTAPRDILPGGFFAGPAGTPIWDGENSTVWFTIKATFLNRCCEFRQRARTFARVGQGPPTMDPDFEDDGYSAAADPDDYTELPDGVIAFSSWDDPGWQQRLINPKGLEFSGWMLFKGYVVDVCNRDQKVGPTLEYAFMALGTPPKIAIRHWGFNP